MPRQKKTDKVEKIGENLFKKKNLKSEAAYAFNFEEDYSKDYLDNLVREVLEEGKSKTYYTGVGKAAWVSLVGVENRFDVTKRQYTITLGFDLDSKQAINLVKFQEAYTECMEKNKRKFTNDSYDNLVKYFSSAFSSIKDKKDEGAIKYVGLGLTQPCVSRQGKDLYIQVSDSKGIEASQKTIEDLVVGNGSEVIGYGKIGRWEVGNKKGLKFYFPRVQILSYINYEQVSLKPVDQSKLSKQPFSFDKFIKSD